LFISTFLLGSFLLGFSAANSTATTIEVSSTGMIAISFLPSYIHLTFHRTRTLLPGHNRYQIKL
jgi:hypothetical protein